MQPRIDAIDVYGGKKPTGPQPPLIAGVSKVTEAIYPDDRWGMWSAHFRAQPHVQHLGGFHWLVTGSRVSIERQFDAFVKGWDSIGGMRPGEFWIVDVERTNWNGQILPDPTIAEVVQFCRLAEAHFGPNRGLLYGNSGWSQFWAWHAANPTFPVWYANSNTDENNPKSGWKLSAQLGAVAWQWGSPVGAVSGVESWAGGPTATDVNHIFHPEWFAALNPPATEDDDMPTIYTFTDANAVLVTRTDPRVPGIVVEWPGPGSDPKVVPWLKALEKCGAKKITGTVADLCPGLWFGSDSSFTAMKKADTRHAWTGDEFRGILPAVKA